MVKTVVLPTLPCFSLLFRDFFSRLSSHQLASISATLAKANNKNPFLEAAKGHHPQLQRGKAEAEEARRKVPHPKPQTGVCTSH